MGAKNLLELILGLRVERSTPLERCPLSLPKIIRNSFNTKDTTQVANIKSQLKRIKTNQKATERNRAYKSELRTVVRAARAAIAAGDKAVAEQKVQLASKKLDKAVSKGVIHKNQAANRKSKLAVKVAAL